jgi:hypothetical protein
MRTASLLAIAMAYALNRDARISREFQPSNPTPRGPGGKTERRAATKRAKQARKQQRGKK